MRLIESIGEWLDARLQLGTSIRETMETSNTSRNLQLVLRIRQRSLRCVHTSNRYRHHARSYLRAVCG